MRTLLPLVALALLGTLAAEDKKNAAPEDGALALEPFQARGVAVSNFAIDFQIYLRPETGKVDTIVITRVAEDSDAADLDVHVGDVITKIDGVPVDGMDAKIREAVKVQTDAFNALEACKKDCPNG